MGLASDFLHTRYEKFFGRPFLLKSSRGDATLELLQLIIISSLFLINLFLKFTKLNKVSNLNKYNLLVTKILKRNKQITELHIVYTSPSKGGRSI